MYYGSVVLGIHTMVS